MSTAKVQEFFNKAQNDPELLEKVRAVQPGDPQRKADALSALSVEAGAPFTSEEFLAAVSQTRELTDSELRGISGGTPSNGCVPCFG